MAIVHMDKIIIASYRDEAPQLLDALQREGIVELLDAERAMASKEWPELETEAKRPRDLEETVARLERTVTFLKARAVDKDATSLFSPRIEVDK
jgi:vacuolar-type H+-ATPase subunit I/STV1